MSHSINFNVAHVVVIAPPKVFTLSAFPGDGGGDAGERAGIAEVGGYSSMSRRFGKSAKRDAGGDRNLARERTRRRRGRSTAVGARRVAHSGHAERAVPRPDGKCITKSERVLFEHQRWSEGTERKIR